MGCYIRFLHSRILLPILLVTLILSVSSSSGATHDKKTIYAIYWRGCEEVCRGFQDYITQRNFNAEIIVRDAQRDRSRLADFLQEARALEVDLILSWGTSVTLGIAGTIDDVDKPEFNNDIPQVFTVVADPVGSWIIASLDRTGRRNITGTFNRVPESVNIAAIRSYMPAFRRLGLIYNSNERNSMLKLAEISALSKQLKFELVALEMELGEDGRPRAEDIPAKVAELKERGVEFIYLGSSSFLDVHRDVFTGAAVANGLPVLSPYERLVRDSHALMSIAARYDDVGRLAGELAEKILVDGSIPGDLPVSRMTDFAYVVNMEVARKLKLFPSVEILQIAETVK